MDERFSTDELLAKRFNECPAAQGTPCNSLVTYVKDRAGHDFRYAIDTQLISSELGYQPRVTFEQGIAKTVDWYLRNEDWWRSVMDGSYQQWIESNYKEMVA